MKNINLFVIFFKFAIRMIYILSLVMAVLGFLVVLFLFIKNPYFFAQDSCLDTGGVWDYGEKRCREDCWKWSKDYGCIKLTKEQQLIFAEYRYRENYIPAKVYKEICLNNQKAWNNKEESCDFYFTSVGCGKLQGDWVYPETCPKVTK